MCYIEAPFNFHKYTTKRNYLQLHKNISISCGCSVASVFHSLFVRNQMHRSQDMTKLCYQVTQFKPNNVSGSIFLAKRSIRFDLSNLFSFDISLCFLQYLLDNLLFGSITLRIQIHCIRLVAAFVNRGHAF